jgi:hypothetical protein
VEAETEHCQQLLVSVLHDSEKKERNKSQSKERMTKHRAVKNVAGSKSTTQLAKPSATWARIYDPSHVLAEFAKMFTHYRLDDSQPFPERSRPASSVENLLNDGVASRPQKVLEACKLFTFECATSINSKTVCAHMDNAMAHHLSLRSVHHCWQDEVVDSIRVSV